MKNFIKVILVCFLAGLVEGEEIVTISVKGDPDVGDARYSEKSIVLNQGDVARILCSSRSEDSPEDRVALFLDGVEVGLPMVRRVWSSNGSAAVNADWVIAGPATLKAKISSTSSEEISFFTASIQRAGAVPSVVPNGSVVIPENPSGNFAVILESSTDMITWTAANPGTYGGSEQKRFFRVRVEQK